MCLQCVKCSDTSYYIAYLCKGCGYDRVLHVGALVGLEQHVVQLTRVRSPIYTQVYSHMNVGKVYSK